MKAAFHLNDSPHQALFGGALREGLKRHGVQIGDASDLQHRPADIVVMWGWKRPHVIEAARRNGSSILVMERGHLQPRMELTSLGWNGLAGRATYPRATDGGARWRRLRPDGVAPWRLPGDGYALLCGQVEGDASLRHLAGGFRQWAQAACDLLAALGYRVCYRPHPLSRQGDGVWLPSRATLAPGEHLADALAGAAVCMTYNSTAGVEAVLAGIPTIAHDRGSMAWPVAAHAAVDAPETPDRTPWCHDMAWTSWTRDEIADGTAVEAVMAARVPAEMTDAA